MERDSFSGSVFSIRGSNITVKEICRRSSYIKSYVVTCDICSGDSELWPHGSIVTTKGSLTKGNLPCGCSRSPRWTKDQWMLKVSRVCKEADFTLIGLEDEWRGKDTKMVLKNNKTGFIWSNTTLNGLVNRGKRDPRESIISRARSNVQDEIGVIDKIRQSGKFHEGCEFRRLSVGKGRGRWEVECPVCKGDVYAKECGSPFIFSASGSSLLNGNLPCRCAPIYKWTEKETLFRVGSLLQGRGDTLVSVEGGYKGSKTLVKWLSVNCNHENITMISKIMSGQRCSVCFKGGFDESQAGLLYITRWNFEGVKYLKYGITNISARSRCIKHKRGSLESPTFEILYEFLGEDGKEVSLCEKRIKETFSRQGACPRELLPEGFTETVEDTPENLETLLQIISTFNLQ